MCLRAVVYRSPVLAARARMVCLRARARVMTVLLWPHDPQPPPADRATAKNHVTRPAGGRSRVVARGCGPLCPDDSLARGGRVGVRRQASAAKRVSSAPAAVKGMLVGVQGA